MKTCSFKKRLQIYLDGWMDERELERFEDHLRSCDDCQTELIELEEMSASALEIVDHAPERTYWDNFFARVHNRINSRGVSPYQEAPKSRFSIKALTYSIGVMTVAASLIFILFNISNNTIDQAPPSVINTPQERPALTDNSAMNIIQPAVTEIERVPSEPEVEKTVNLSKATGDKSQLAKSAVVSAKSGIENRDEFADISEADVLSTFRGSVPLQPGKTTPSEDENFIGRLLAEYSGSYDGIAGVKPNVVAEGLISGYVSGGVNQGSIPGSVRDLNNQAINPRWGYLGLPFDTTNRGEFDRYTIELNLMRAK